MDGNDEWRECFGDSDKTDRAVVTELLPVGGRLPELFTTKRCYFGAVAERWSTSQRASGSDPRRDLDPTRVARPVTASGI